jgi:ABC-type sugar transport system ATPase subunit
MHALTSSWKTKRNPMNGESGLYVKDVSLAFRSETILSNANLTVEMGGILALLGPSGSGKSTLLRVIAGLQPPDRGRVFIDGRDVTHTPPQERGVSMLFQQPALFPGKTISTNALAARRARKVAKAEITEATAEVLAMMDEFDLTRHKEKVADHLSGGQYQRAAIIRCLTNARGSKLLLLDEPFQSNLNLALRWRLMEWIRNWQRKQKLTCLLVTHDFAEAAFFADRIAVIDDGRGKIVTDHAMAMFNRPPDLEIARIVGPTNEWELRKFAYKLPIPELEPTPPENTGAEWSMCRPSNVTAVPNGMGFEVETRTFLGPWVRLELASIAVPTFKITADMSASAAACIQQTCGLRIERFHVAFYDNRLELLRPGSAAENGVPVTPEAQ